MLTAPSEFINPSTDYGANVNGVRYFDTTNNNYVDAYGVVREYGSDGYSGTVIKNGTFDSEDDWFVGAGWSIADGKVTRNTSTGWEAVDQLEVLNVGSFYRVEFDIVEYTSGVLQVYTGGALETISSPAVGHVVLEMQEATDGTNFFFRGKGDAGSFIGSIDNVSVKEYNANAGAPITDIAGHYVGDVANPTNGGVADATQTDFPSGLVNDFVLQCEWTPDLINTCTLLETGNVKLSWAANVLSLAKGAITATVALTPVQGTTYSIQGRISAEYGVDVWVGETKGTGNADVTNAVPSAVLSIGSDE